MTRTVYVEQSAMQDFLHITQLGLTRCGMFSMNAPCVGIAMDALAYLYKTDAKFLELAKPFIEEELAIKKHIKKRGYWYFTTNISDETFNTLRTYKGSLGYEEVVCFSLVATGLIKSLRSLYQAFRFADKYHELLSLYAKDPERSRYKGIDLKPLTEEADAALLLVQVMLDKECEIQNPLEQVAKLRRTVGL